MKCWKFSSPHISRVEIFILYSFRKFRQNYLIFDFFVRVSAFSVYSHYRMPINIGNCNIVFNTNNLIYLEIYDDHIAHVPEFYISWVLYFRTQHLTSGCSVAALPTLVHGADIR